MNPLGVALLLFAGAYLIGTGFSIIKEIVAKKRARLDDKEKERKENEE